MHTAFDDSRIAMRDLFASAIETIDGRFGADYARKNPQLFAALMDVGLRSVEIEQEHFNAME